MVLEANILDFQKPFESFKDGDILIIDQCPMSTMKKKVVVKISDRDFVSNKSGAKVTIPFNAAKSFKCRKLLFISKEESSHDFV